MKIFKFTLIIISFFGSVVFAENNTRNIQAMLKKMDYKVSSVDGLMGKNTMNVIRSFYYDLGFELGYDQMSKVDYEGNISAVYKKLTSGNFDKETCEDNASQIADIAGVINRVGNSSFVKLAKKGGLKAIDISIPMLKQKMCYKKYKKNSVLIEAIVPDKISNYLHAILVSLNGPVPK